LAITKVIFLKFAPLLHITNTSKETLFLLSEVILGSKVKIQGQTFYYSEVILGSRVKTQGQTFYFAISQRWIDRFDSNIYHRYKSRK
jgi:hypothetical protein